MLEVFLCHGNVLLLHGLLHVAEAAVELGVGGRKGCVGIHLIVAAQVGDGKEQVS